MYSPSHFNGFHPMATGIASYPQQLYAGEGVLHGGHQPVAATGYGYHLQFLPGGFQFPNFILLYQEFPRQVVRRHFGSSRGGNNNLQMLISLGYGYVNFSNPHDAAYARERLNFTPINGREIRIMFSHRDPSIRKSGVGNVFIKNLDQSIDNKALYETFAGFGVVLSCKVAVNSHGQSKGHGFVQFDRMESALNAIKQLNGMLINDKKVYVGFFAKRRVNGVNRCVQFTNVFVKNLPETTTDDELNNFFGEFGCITSCVVMKDENGKSKCFGFVNFENPNDAATAVDKLNGVPMGEKVLYVGKAQRKSEREAELKVKFQEERRRRFEQFHGSNLYIKNLDESFNDETLKELFSSFGTVTSCKVMVNARGVSKGYAFVAFSTKEEASKAMYAMNRKKIGRKPLYVSVAERKEDRRARLLAQYAQQSIGAMAPMPFTMNGFHPVAATGFGYHQQFLPGGFQFPNFILPYQEFPRQVVMT